MPATAAQQYWSRRARYREALEIIATIPDADIRTLLSTALTADVRRKFRGISDALTDQMGTKLSTVPEGYEGGHIEHAVPLRLIHNHILGIIQAGAVDPATYDLFPDTASIQAFVGAFVVGVEVTPEQHGMLNRQNMHGEWDWLANFPAWNWNELQNGEWNFAARPQWLIAFMNRYENVPPPEGPLEYRPSQGRTEINLRSARDIQYWTAIFAVSEEELRRVVLQVGNSVAAVRQALGGPAGAVGCAV